MFHRFLETHSLSDYDLSSDIFPMLCEEGFISLLADETCVAEAEKELSYAWPIIKATDFMAFRKSGSRTAMEIPYFDRRTHLYLFVFAEAKENKGRFLPQIVDGIFAICEETFWGLSAHQTGKDIPPADPQYIDIFAAETAALLVTAMRLLHKPLYNFCPEIFPRVEYELERRIKVPYETNTDFWWMGNDGSRVNNWNPWVLSNMLTVFLCTEKDKKRLENAVRKIMCEIEHYYDSVPEDGGCDEGTGYWGHAGGCLFEILYQLKLASGGKMDLFYDEKIRLIAEYMKKAHVIKDRFINVADASPTGHGDMMPLLFGYAKELADASLMNFAAGVYKDNSNGLGERSHRSRGASLRRFIYYEYFKRELMQYPMSYPLHTGTEFLPKTEIAVLHTGDMSLVAKGGFNEESHNHNDVGSFSLYDEETPIFADLGISTYTRFTFDNATRYTMIPWTRSSYHCLPIINETEQKNGAEYRSNGFSLTDGGVSVSFASAYPETAEVTAVERYLSLTETGATVTDRFNFIGDNRKVCEVFMCVLPVALEKNTAVIDGRYRVTASVGEFHTEFVRFDDKKLASDWGTEGATRLLLSAENENEIIVKVEKI